MKLIVQTRLVFFTEEDQIQTDSRIMILEDFLYVTLK